MQHQQPHSNLLRFTAPIPSIPAFPNGFQSPFPDSYKGFPPTNRTDYQPATLRYLESQAQSLHPPGYSISAPSSALPSPALPNEVYFSPFAHEYTSYFSLEATELPAARRNTPFVHRRSRVVMACTYCRRRKIRCDGADPCTNCAKSCRGCDYTPVPADLNSNRRRRALTESQDISPANDEADNGEVPSVLSKNDISPLLKSPPPLPPMHTLLAPSAQRPQGLAPNPLDVNSARAIDTSNRNGYTSDFLPSAAEPGLLSSGFGHIPPPSVPGQQMQWALVPVWRPDANEQLPSQLTAPMPGFGSSRMMHNQFPSLNIQPKDPNTVYHPVPSYQQGSMGYHFSTTVPTGFPHNSLQLQQANSHTAANARGYATDQMQHHGYGMAGAADLGAMPHHFPVSARGQMIGQESTHVDSAFCFSNRNGTEQLSAYPLESSSTSTSFSSQGFSNAAPMQACGSSVASPPYTPLPQSTISGYSAIGHDMFRQQQEDTKHVYAPAVMMHMPPETPALASPIKQNNFMPEQTGMVGLGIMMPGM